MTTRSSFVRAVRVSVAVVITAVGLCAFYGQVGWPVSKGAYRVLGNITSRSSGPPYAPKMLCIRCAHYGTTFPARRAAA